MIGIEAALHYDVGEHDESGENDGMSGERVRDEDEELRTLLLAQPLNPLERLSWRILGWREKEGTNECV